MVDGLITFSLLLIEVGLRLRLLPRPRDRVIGLGTLVWIRFAGSRRSSRPTSSQLASSATTRTQKFAEPEATIRKPRGRRAPRSAAGGADRPRAMPIEIRRFGVGHRRPDGPPGTTGVTGQVIHSDARGVDRASWPSRAVRRIEPHANPNTTWFIVIEGGGWVGVGDERTRVAAGEAVLWPADVTHAAWTEHSEMRAIVVEFAGADDQRCVLDRARRLALAAEGRRRAGRSRATAPWPTMADAGRPAITRAASPPDDRVGQRASTAPSWLRIRAVAPQTDRPSTS